MLLSEYGDIHVVFSINKILHNHTRKGQSGLQSTFDARNETTICITTVSQFTCQLYRPLIETNRKNRVWSMAIFQV
jgi:hypothetical protein